MNTVIINGGSSTLIKSNEGIEDKVSQRIFPHPFASVIVKGALSKDIFKDYAKNYQDPSTSSILFTRSRFFMDFDFLSCYTLLREGVQISGHTDANADQSGPDFFRFRFNRYR